MDLAIAANENYAPGLLVTVASLLNSLDEKTSITIHFLNGGISTRSMARLQKICQQLHPRCSLVNIPFDDACFAGFTVGPGKSYMAYSRLLLGSIIKVDKVIYVDSDMLILRDLSELWALDMGGKMVLACKDAWVLTLGDDCPWPLDEAASKKQYFNSGFLVIDLVSWRQKAVEATALQLAKTAQCRFWDQTILNYALQNDVAYLPIDWNWLFKSERDSTMFPLKNYHFPHYGKPWMYYRGFFRDRAWRLFYSKCVGNVWIDIVRHGYAQKQFRHVIVYFKDLLAVNSNVFAFFYFKYLKWFTRHGLDKTGIVTRNIAERYRLFGADFPRHYTDEKKALADLKAQLLVKMAAKN